MPKKKRKRGSQPSDCSGSGTASVNKRGGGAGGSSHLSEDMAIIDFPHARLRRVMLEEDASGALVRGVKKEALLAMNLTVNYFLKDLVVQVAQEAMKNQSSASSVKLKTEDLQTVIGANKNFNYLTTIFSKATDGNAEVKVVEEIKSMAKRNEKVDKLKQSDILQPTSMLQLAAEAGEHSWSVLGAKESQVEGEVMNFDEEEGTSSDDDW